MPAADRSDLVLRTARIAITVGLVVVIGLVAWKAMPALLLLFGAFLFAVLIGGAAHLIDERTPLPYKGALALVGLVLALVVGGGLWLIGDTLATQVAGVSTSLPEAVGQVDAVVADWAMQLGFEDPPALREAVPPVGQSASAVLGIVGGAVGVFANIVVVVLVGAFFAAAPATYRKGILHLVPLDRRARVGDVLDSITHALRKWLFARLIAMGLTAVFTYIGLTIVGVPFTLGLALIAGAAAFIPYIGAYIGGAVGVLVALTDGPQTALYALLVYVAIENIQGWTIEPLIESRLTAAPPALLLGAQVVLGMLLGIGGVILASPLVVCLAVMVQMLYVEDTLGDRVDVLGN